MAFNVGIISLVILSIPPQNLTPLRGLYLSIDHVQWSTRFFALQAIRKTCFVLARKALCGDFKQGGFSHLLSITIVAVGICPGLIIFRRLSDTFVDGLCDLNF